jgi:hypothetical protein
VEGKSKVVGSGLIASLFKTQEISGDNVIFASGVSNSLETEDYKFQREIDLLLKTAQSFPQHRMIYFSSIPIIRPETHRYFAHKKKIEDIICEHIDRYIILRLPSVVGLANKNTLLNFLARALSEDQDFSINRTAKRRFIRAIDVAQITRTITETNPCNCVLDLCSDSSIAVMDIVYEIASALNKKPKKINFYEAYESLTVDNTPTKNLLGRSHMLFEPQYNRKCLEYFLMSLRERNK